MLRIHTNQMAAFAEQQVSLFVDRMVDRLKTQFANELEQQNLEETDLEPFVRQGILNAERYGVTSDRDVELYIDCMVLCGPKFDQDDAFPWARRILRQKILNGREKMDQISNHLIFGMDEPR